MKDVEHYLELLKKKDLNTYYHSIRVAQYSYLIGKTLEYTNEQLSFLVVSALLHDIGKLYIPDSILKKPSKLTEQEYEKIKNHPLYAKKILQDYDSKLLEVIVTHHERLDGSGYPYQLLGSTIPCFAQILAVADSFDAMTSNRNYNLVKSFQEATCELWNCSTQENNLYNSSFVFSLNQALHTDTLQHPKMKQYTLQRFFRKLEE